jgi:hypothetical protein
MIEHLKAIKAALDPLGYTTHLVAAAEVTGQYLVLGGRSWDRPDEMPVCNTTDSLVTDWRLTAVAGTPEGVGTMLRRARELLSPQLAPSRIPMAGRDVRVWFERGEFIGVDRDTVNTTTGRHPAYGVDTYRLTSEPA